MLSFCDRPDDGPGLKRARWGLLATPQEVSDDQKMSTAATVLHVQVRFPGRDQIEAQLQNGVWSIQVIGCFQLQDQVAQRQKQEADLTKWALPEGHHHTDLLLRELILKARQEWNFPYFEAEICHCRSVPTDIVDQAILAGAHDTRKVSAQTAASTNCGTCRPDVQKVLNYRLGVK